MASLHSKANCHLHQECKDDLVIIIIIMRCHVVVLPLCSSKVDYRHCVRTPEAQIGSDLFQARCHIVPVKARVKVLTKPLIQMYPCVPQDLQI